MARAGGVADPLGQRQAPVDAVRDATQQLLGAGLAEGHRRGGDRAQPRGVVVDADHAQAAVGEGEGERQTDASEPDHGHVGGTRAIAALARDRIGGAPRSAHPLIRGHGLT